MSETFIVHILRHCGWHTITAEGGTFGEAAVAAVVATCKQFGLDLDRIPHTVEYVDEEIDQAGGGTFRYRRVRFNEVSERSVFDPFIARGWTTTKPGDYWFAHRVEEGKPGDCPACGGTGVEYDNPFRGCWKCTDGGPRSKKPAAAVVAENDPVNEPDFSPAGHLRAKTVHHTLYRVAEPGEEN